MDKSRAVVASDGNSVVYAGRPFAVANAVVIASGLEAANVSNVGNSVLAAATVVDVNAANVGAALIVVSARVVSMVALELGVVKIFVVLVAAMYG